APALASAGFGGKPTTDARVGGWSPSTEEGYVNWVAIIVATIAALVIGFLWYGTWAFGKSWMALAGRGMGEGQQPGPLYALTALAALVEAIALSWFISQTGWRTGSGGALRRRGRLHGVRRRAQVRGPSLRCPGP